MDTPTNARFVLAFPSRFLLNPSAAPRAVATSRGTFLCLFRCRGSHRSPRANKDPLPRPVTRSPESAGVTRRVLDVKTFSTSPRPGHVRGQARIKGGSKGSWRQNISPCFFFHKFIGHRTLPPAFLPMGLRFHGPNWRTGGPPKRTAGGAAPPGQLTMEARCNHPTYETSILSQWGLFFLWFNHPDSKG